MHQKSKNEGSMEIFTNRQFSGTVNTENKDFDFQGRRGNAHFCQTKQGTGIPLGGPHNLHSMTGIHTSSTSTQEIHGSQVQTLNFQEDLS